MDKKELQTQIEQGATQIEMATKLGVSQSTVRYYLKKYSMRTKNKVGRRPKLRAVSLCASCQKPKNYTLRDDRQMPLLCQPCLETKIGKPETKPKVMNPGLRSGQKGDVSEACVLSRALVLGYTVSLPFGSDSRYDMIFDIDGTLNKVQVKTGRFQEGVILFNVTSVNGRVRKTNQRKYTDDEIDLFAVYCSELAQSYLIPVNEASGQLRVEKPNNNQQRNIMWAKDFEF